MWRDSAGPGCCVEVTHIVKKERGANVTTLCGRTISKGAAGTAFQRGSAPPFIWLHDSRHETLIRLHTLCASCVEELSDRTIETRLCDLFKYLKGMHEIHIRDYNQDTGVVMMCRKAWDVKSLFKNKIGFIDVVDVAKHYTTPQMCRDCSDHPEAQLYILAGVDL